MTKLYSSKLVRGLVVVLMIITLVTPQLVQAASQSDLDAAEQKLQDLRNQKTRLEAERVNASNRIGTYASEIEKLRGEIEILQLDVAEVELRIQELQLGIDVLKQQIADREQAIATRLEEIGVLEDETNTRISFSYMDFRTTRKNRLDMISAKDINSYFKDSQYQVRIQSATNQALVEVLQLKVQLERDKELLDERSIDLRRDQAMVDENKKQLTNLQNRVEKDIENYYAQIYSAQAQVAGAQSGLSYLGNATASQEAEVDRIRQELFDKIGSVDNGNFVNKGDLIGYQGSTGLATGPHVHFQVYKNGVSKNPCSYMPGGKFSNCHGNGQLSWPLSGAFYFTSGYGNRCLGSSCSFHSAIDLAHSSWNAPVYAAHSGYTSKGIDEYGGLYVTVCENASNCNSGFKSVYLHLSSY